MDSRAAVTLALLAALALAVFVRRRDDLETMQAMPSASTLPPDARRALERGVVEVVARGYAAAAADAAKAKTGAKPLCSKVAADARREVAAAMNARFGSYSAQARGGLSQVVPKLLKELDDHVRKTRCSGAANRAVDDPQALKKDMDDLVKSLRA